MKIVFLDAASLGSDTDYSEFEKLGEVVRYPASSPEEVPARIVDADVMVINKVPVNEKTIGSAQNLKLVCVTATGTDHRQRTEPEAGMRHRHRDQQFGQRIPGKPRNRMAQRGRLFHGIRGAAHICHAVLSDGASATL